MPTSPFSLYTLCGGGIMTQIIPLTDPDPDTSGHKKTLMIFLILTKDNLAYTLIRH
jgi:hypothetical protein